MTTRRAFLGATLTAISAATFGSISDTFALRQPFSGIIYTASNPGKWSKKVKTHAPIISVEGKKVTITTAHPMTQNHYIVRHTLVLEDGTVLGAKTFYPEKDRKAISTFELPPNYKATIYATSFCNLHDFWMSQQQV